MTLRRIIVSTLFATVGCALANAATISSVAGTVTFATDNTYTLTLSKFNTSLGTLTGATIYFFGSENLSQLHLGNTSSTVETFDLVAISNILFGSTNTANSSDKYTNESLDLFDTGIGPGQSAFPTTPGPITLGVAGSGTCPLGTPSSTCGSVNYTPPNLVINNTDAVYGFSVGTGLGGVTGVLKTLTLADALANYTGVGTFNLGGGTKSLTTFSGGGNNINLDVTSNATFNAEIDYQYTPSGGTPEPATMVLFGSGLLAVGLIRKRVRG